MLLSNFISWWPCSSLQSQPKSVASAHSSSSESGSTSDSDSSSDSETESHSSDSEANDPPRAPAPEVNASKRQRLLTQPLASHSLLYQCSQGRRPETLSLFRCPFDIFAASLDFSCPLLPFWSLSALVTLSNNMIRLSDAQPGGVPLCPLA